MVTLGTTGRGLRHVLGALHRGRYGMEDPGYRGADRETVGALGRPVHDLRTPRRRLPRGPGRSVSVTAGAPAPAGPGRARGQPARPARRRPEHAGARVLEDDYDSRTATTSRRCPPWPRWTAPPVTYLGTAWKAVAPSLQLGWLVPPPNLLNTVNQQQQRPTRRRRRR